jgi:pectin methylesterase-like acyl-CoA thioesterase/pectate lyase
MPGKGENMKKSVRKKGWFKRISAVIMAVALILSGISIPDGLFAVKAKAAENSSASWSMSDKMYKEGDSENTVSELNKAKGTLVNSNNDELILDATSAKITNRNQDFQVNTDLVLTFPLVENARTCTITIQSYNELTNDNIEIAGMSDYVFTTDTTTSYKSYIIKGVVNKGVTEVSVKLKLNTYFNSIKIDSSTSTATTSAAFSADKLSGFETGKTISAEWNYSNGTISDSGSNTQIYNKTGKYTNKDGDVLYIDASKENGAAFKLDSSYSRIQLNKGVEINVPVVGDKAVITLLLSKNYTGTTTEDILTDSMISINDNSNLLYKKCTSNEKYDDNYRKIEITCYLSGAEGEITVISNVAKNYLQSLSIQCEELEKTSIKGTITSSSAIPDGTSVVAVNKTTGLQYSGIISDNMYSVEVPVEDEEMEYELSISNPAYIITSGITSVKVSKEASGQVTADITIMKLSTKMVTGNITGIADEYDVSQLGVSFLTDADTEYVPEVVMAADKKSYSARVEKGVTYNVVLTGADDYEITSAHSGVSYTEDGVLDITAGLKPTYAVTLNLPDKPDLTGKNIIYTYTNKDNSRYTYSFDSKDNIRLREGSYTLTIGGDFIAQPYKLKSGADITVKSGEVTQKVILEQITSWSFVSGSGDYFNKTIQNNTGYYNGLYIDASTGKLAASGDKAQFNGGTKIVVPVTGRCTVSVEAYSGMYALYTIGGEAASTTTAVSSYRYDSKEAGTVEIVSTGGDAYIKSISVVYDAKEVEYVKQPKMPVITGSTDSLVVQPEGQRLKLTQTGGTLSADKTNISSTVSYYGFEETADINKLSADIIINSCGNSSSNGLFFGAYDGSMIATAGIRKSTELKQIYYKGTSEPVGAGSALSGTVAVGTMVHFEMVKTDEGLAISVTPKGQTEQQLVYKYTSTELFKTDKAATAVSYGFVLAGVEATIKNMKYEAADGKVLYDQNKCYKAEGTAPEIDTVTAIGSDTREYIDVSWTNKVEADGDGLYVLEVSQDNGSTWSKVESALTDTSYRYILKEAGDYKFRVSGKLGVDGEINSYVESDKVYIRPALDKPVLSTLSTSDKINVAWDKVNGADTYELYRYSYDETSDNAKLIATISECAYEDSDVEAEMPYYYYVIAYSHIDGRIDNYSNPSDSVWAVPSAGHTGEYAYEDSSAGLTITRRSYNTVYDGKLTLEGVVEKQSTVTLKINGTVVDEKSVAVKGTFAFTDASLSAGRNDVELLIKAKDGSVTRETFNYVYLTNYDKVVDSAYDGTDGEQVNGIPTYKTVQAAVNSVDKANTKRVVILVKEGDYNEHLVVSSPYISLIGEDSEKTRIYYDVKELAGGDMDKRCAVRIESTAHNFTAENLTFENTYNYLGDGTKSNESADALSSDADNASYINVRILGYQDTLCANKGTQYYYKCYIAGNVDFIYGNEPRALFNDCKLVFRYNANKNSGYVCAPKTSADAAYGLTFYKCQVLSEDGCSGNKYYLARPWGADAYITWIDCYMGKILRANAANPYADMSGNSAKAARFYEYGSYGPGYAINANRSQISKKKADEMIKINYLGWDPYSVFSAVGINYAGNVTTKAEQKYVTTQYVSDTYNENDGDDTGLYKYNVEGYAASAGVTGGGNLLEESKNYYKAGSAKEFLDAIKSVKASGRASVIELTADIALGDKEVEGYSEYKSFITAHKNYPITHPDLISSGVSMLKLAGMSNLTIYSKNGAKITHTCIDITGSDNIIIRNIKFDELWEWDDETSGGYDRNDWDYMTIEKGSSNIWIDHCTFYKAYDGVIDIKTPSAYSNITISWCEFLPASDGGTFFDNMMNAMKANPDGYAYYKHLLESGMTHEQICNYAYGQKKTHLLGQSDEDTSSKNITVTFANNYYKDSMDRMPRLRFGTAHVYNCIMDAQNLRNYRQDIEKTAGSEYAQKIVSNGASSNCGAHMLLENCYMSGMTNALISGNGSSAAGYINAFNSIYMLDGKQAELKVALNTDKAGEVALVQDREEFKNALPYSDYVLYAADSLSTEVQPYTGAGKLKDLTTLQWERTSYNDSPLVHKEHVWNDGEISKDSTCTEAGEKVYTCKVCGETKTEAIEALDHAYSEEWTVDKEATCEEAGSKSHHCTRPGCDSKSDVTVIEALGHEWGEGTETKAPTCTEAGEKTYTCTRCDKTKTEAIEALGHAYSEEWTVDKEATCEEAGSKSHHCTRPGCDSKTEVTEIAALGHEWGEGTETKAPTCTEAGEKTYTCTRCNATKTEAIEALGHAYSEEWTVDKEATCEEAGSKSHHCTRPGCDSKTEVTEIAALGHEWGEGTETKAPTCTEAGEKTYTCTRCDKTKTEAIEALGHAYSEEWTVDKEATCEEAGSKSHHCTRPDCDSKSEVTEIAALGHEWGEGKETKAPTCTEAGEKTYTCTRCNATKTEAIEALGHAYSDEWTVDKEATCEEAGSKSHHCTRLGCDSKSDVTVIEALGHEWGEGKETKAPTCTEAGEKTYTCTRCEKTKTEAIEALGHAYSEEWTVDKEATCEEAGSKSHHCTRPGCDSKSEVTVIEALGHEWGEGKETKSPTCTEAGEKTYTCTRCNATKKEAIEALGHAYSDEWTVDKEATCEEAGSKSHHCTRPGCDGKSDVTVIEALGHEWGEGKETKAPTCTEAGEKTYTCTRCSATKTEEVAALGHDYSDEWTVDKEATTTETGSKSHHCKVCGDKTDVTIIPMIKADVSINVEVVKKEDTPDTTIEGSNNEIINSVFTEEEIKAFKNGVKVEVTIDINNIENKVTDSDKKLIDNKLKADEKIGTILDIVLNKNVDGNKNSVHELNSDIKLKVAIPENIINKDASIKREYSVIRIHNGESENISVDYNENDNTIIFETDRFSTYAIVYKDIIKNTEDNNQSVIPDNNTSVDSKDNSVATSDTMHAAGTVWLLFAISSGMICVLSRRRKKNI